MAPYLCCQYMRYAQISCGKMAFPHKSTNTNLTVHFILYTVCIQHTRNIFMSHGTSTRAHTHTHPDRGSVANIPNFDNYITSICSRRQVYNIASTTGSTLTNPTKTYILNLHYIIQHCDIVFCIVYRWPSCCMRSCTYTVCVLAFLLQKNRHCAFLSWFAIESVRRVQQC